MCNGGGVGGGGQSEDEERNRHIWMLEDVRVLRKYTVSVSISEAKKILFIFCLSTVQKEQECQNWRKEKRNKRHEVGVGRRRRRGENGWMVVGNGVGEKEDRENYRR